MNLDDCWSVKSGRDSVNNQLVPDPDKFPDGISGLADTIHGMGFKLGIYSSAGTLTCADYPASIGYESLDAATWAAWGVDCKPVLSLIIPLDPGLQDSSKTSERTNKELPQKQQTSSTTTATSQATGPTSAKRVPR